MPTIPNFPVRMTSRTAFKMMTRDVKFVRKQEKFYIFQSLNVIKTICLIVYFQSNDILIENRGNYQYSFNPCYITDHILHTASYTLSMVDLREFVSKIKVFFTCFTLSHN